MRVAARRSMHFCPLKGYNRHVLYVPALRVSTATATGATIKKPLMKKPWGAWGWGVQLGAGRECEYLKKKVVVVWRRRRRWW